MKREFPDSVPIFGEEALKSQFGPGTLPGLPMVSVKTAPHRMQNSLIVGDAAHAIVPFYGQGRFPRCFLMNDFNSFFSFY